MSKKKKRRMRREKRLRAQRIQPSSIYNEHHLCFIRRMWRGGAIREFRQFHYCIIELPKDTLHKHIHQNMISVPVPSNFAAQAALEQLKLLEEFGAISDKDTIEQRLRILIAVFDCMAQPTADGFRKQLDIVNKFYNQPS